MAIDKRSSAKYIISQTMQKIDGIGRSKTAEKEQSNIKGQNGHKISFKAHSIKQMQNARTVLTQYAEFLKENHGSKIYSHINSETARDFLVQKSTEVSGGTLNTYISTMAKLSDNFNQLGISAISRNEITDIRQEFKENNVSLEKNHYNRAYTTEQISDMRTYMQNTEHSLSFELQHQIGLRADDALNSQKWQINETSGTLTIIGSKNGLNYETAPLQAELLEKVIEAKEQGYKASYSEYREELKQAGAENGSHGLRYSFAQNRVQELQSQGYGEQEAKAQTSLELGHSRIEITNHYLA